MFVMVHDEQEIFLTVNEHDLPPVSDGATSHLSPAPGAGAGPVRAVESAWPLAAIHFKHKHTQERSCYIQAESPIVWNKCHIMGIHFLTPTSYYYLTF